MLKSRTIAIAILSAFLSLSQVDSAAAATPLTTVRVAAKPTEPLHMGRAPGDFDRAFIVQLAVENPIKELPDEKQLAPQADVTR
jgi:hypothetical protein